MSIQCATCGQILPRDDARFCSNCGTPVSAPSPGSQSLSSPKDVPAPSAGQAYKNRSALREQIAQQSPFQPPRRPRSERDGPPPWISQLNTRERSQADVRLNQQGKSPTDVKAEPSTSSSPGVQNGQTPQMGPLTKEDEEALDPTSSDAPIAEPVPQKSAVRELRVKVWEQEDPLTVPPPTTKEDTMREQENIVASFPTMPMIAEQTSLQARHASLPPPILGVQTPRFDEVTQRDTMLLSTQDQVKPASQASANSVREPQQQPQPEESRAVVQGSINTGQYPSSFAQPAQARGWAQKPSTSALVSPMSLRRPGSRVPLVFGIVLLCVLVVGGLCAWVYVLQPFSIPQVTQPQRSFQDAGLGVSLSYPNGWMVQLDQSAGTVHFSDSTHTAQFTVVVVATSGQDAGQYLLQEAKQLGVTGAKPGSPLSFGKTTWQQAQGSIVQDGANYTETLLVTMHANRLYSVIQQAPQGSYADEEQVIFKTMRSSFQFLL